MTRLAPDSRARDGVGCLVLAVLAISGCGGECLAHCEWELTVEARVEHSGPIRIELCDGASCWTGEIEPDSAGALGPGAAPQVQWYASELTIRSGFTQFGPVSDAGLGNRVRLSVTARDGAVLVDADDVPEATHELGCGDGCWDRYVRF